MIKNTDKNIFEDAAKLRKFQECNTQIHVLLQAVNNRNTWTATTVVSQCFVTKLEAVRVFPNYSL